jgi:hypothetical protein
MSIPRAHEVFASFVSTYARPAGKWNTNEFPVTDCVLRVLVSSSIYPCPASVTVATTSPHPSGVSKFSNEHGC